MIPILAAGLGGLSIAQWAIAIIIVIAVIAIVFIFTRQAGITIPPFIIQVFWVLLAAVICIAAIKFLVSM